MNIKPQQIYKNGWDLYYKVVSIDDDFIYYYGLKNQNGWFGKKSIYNNWGKPYSLVLKVFEKEMELFLDVIPEEIEKDLLFLF